MNTQGALNLLFRPGLRADFRDEWNRYDPEHPFFLKQGSMDMPEISATILTGPSRMYELGDGEPITYEDLIQGPKVMGVDKEFGLGFMVTRKTVQDDQYGKASQAAKWLANAARMTEEYRAASLLDDAFTGSTFKGIDSLALCHTAHTLIGSSSTVANRPASDVAFGMTGVNACMDLYQLMKDWNGDPTKLWPTKLIIGNNSGDVNKATQILNSTLEPFTANNQENAMKSRLKGLNFEVSHYKISTKSYFFIDERYNDCWFLRRSALSFEDTEDFDTKAAKFTATERFLIWFVDWHAWVGVNPT